MLARRSIGSSKNGTGRELESGVVVELPPRQNAATTRLDGQPMWDARALDGLEDELALAHRDLEAERMARAELATLLHATEHRLAAAERVTAESQQRPALKNFLLELNRRMEMLRARDRELAALTAQLEAAERANNALREELAAERAGREQLETCLIDLHAQRSTPLVPPEPAQPSAAPPPSPALGVSPAARAAAGDALALVHLEQQDALQAIVHAATEKFGQVTYSAGTSDSRAAEARTVLAINILSAGADPWNAISTHVGAAEEEMPVFAYWVDGERGFVAGLVDYFREPFDPHTYAARLLCRGVQRVLTVSEHIDGMAMLRATLAEAQCSTSVVFDAKQALDLLPMVNPDTVLIDLALPKGEAFRLIARLRAEPKAARVRVGVFFSRPVDPAELAQQARRVAQGVPFAAADLTHALMQALGPDGLGKPTRREPTRAPVRDHQAITLYASR
jgi:CheY-like chemotaxis protein